MLSLVLAVHNEGPELNRTLSSLFSGTAGAVEAVVVDDGSTDGCCDAADGGPVRVIRNEQRVGVAASRQRAIAATSGNMVAVVDGHQRVSRSALNRCVREAGRHRAIIVPDIRGFSRRMPTIHGASFQLCPHNGFFSSEWNTQMPRGRVTQVTALRAPTYVMSRDVYDEVRWIDGLRSWGASETVLSLKAFFLGIPILHLCGALTFHRFKKALHYNASMDDVWRNHALTARVCFDDRSWYEYWLPQVFGRHLSEEAMRDTESGSIVAQHAEFCRLKVRADAEFWTHLLQQPVPHQLT